MLLAATVANAFCAGARFLLWRMHPNIPGTGRWTLAGFASVLALFLVMSFAIFHWTISLTIAQLLAVLGLMLAWDGFRRFVDQPPLPPSVQTILIAILAVWLLIAHYAHSILLREVGNAVLVGILSGLIARDLLIAGKHGRPAVRATGWLYGINATIFLLRAIYSHTSPHIADTLNPSGTVIFISLWWLCMFIATTLGMFLMTSEHLQAELDVQANLDPLTGAHNRRAFSLLADKAISRIRRHSKSLSALLMDLDNFKQINDRLGHEAGDTLLCLFVSSVKCILRGEDIFCRFGGEEFVAMLPDTTGDAAFNVAERLRKSFEAETTHIDSLNSLSIPLTVSIGVAELRGDEDIDALLRRADSALYQAKDSGRNCSKLAENNLQEKEPSLPVTAAS